MYDLKRNQQANDLSKATLPSYTTQYSITSALVSGAVVDVTQWSSVNCFGATEVRLLMTARLFRLLCRNAQGGVGKDERDLIRLAGEAWAQAQELGRQATSFHCFLYSDDGVGREQQLRLEHQDDPNEGYVVTIGFADEFALLA